MHNLGHMAFGKGGGEGGGGGGLSQHTNKTSNLIIH